MNLKPSPEQTRREILSIYCILSQDQKSILSSFALDLILQKPLHAPEQDQVVPVLVAPRLL